MMIRTRCLRQKHQETERPQEGLDKLKEKNVAVVEYRVEPEAEEYRISQRIAEKQSQGKTPVQEV